MNSQSQAVSPPLRILSLGERPLAPVLLLLLTGPDGGGIRGISSLLILEELMEGVRKARGLDHVPLPCEHFDFIGGTSTGGYVIHRHILMFPADSPYSIIAIMLGRLRMSVDDCLKEYREVAQKAFTPKRRLNPLPAPPKGAFSATALEDAVKYTSRKFCTAPECAALRQQGNPTARTCPHGELEFRDETCTKTYVFLHASLQTEY